MLSVKRTFPVRGRYADLRGRAVWLWLASGPGPPALAGTASEKGVVSPRADPRELCPKRSGLGLSSADDGRSKDGDMERSHTHLGRTDVENANLEGKCGRPGDMRINTPEQDMRRQKYLRGKNDQ